jgi:hypothetical protein
MNLLRTAFAAATLSAAALGAFAQTTPRIDVRQADQQARIDQGVAAGTLTPREANRLDAGQQHVANVEGRAAADGTVSARERMHLTHAQNRTSRHLYHQKHDAQSMVSMAH